MAMGIEESMIRTTVAMKSSMELLGRVFRTRKDKYGAFITRGGGDQISDMEYIKRFDCRTAIRNFAVAV